MRRASVAAAGFAFAGGSAADPAGVVHVAAAPDRHGRLLLACVEPLEHSPRGTELAAVALRSIRETFGATPGPSVEALITAFAVANATVLAQNRPGVTGRRERRICVGATAIALAGREIVVAQAAPSQAILVQDGQVYAFPEIASWRGDYTLDSPAIEAFPLGFAEEHAPRLCHSEAAPGDLIALCATSVGRALGRDDDAVLDLYGGSLLTDDLEGSVDRLERLLARHDVEDAFAVVAAITRLPRGSWSPMVPLVRRPARGRGADAARTRPAAAAAPPRAIVGATSELSAAPAVEQVRNRVIDIAEWASGRGGAPVAAYALPQRALAAPGALSVSRYRESSGLPPEWRANLPRAPGLHLPTRVLAVSLLAFAVLGGTGVAVSHQRDREARAAASLQAADVALRGALENPGSGMSSVAEAEAALKAALASGASGEPLRQRERELSRIRDQVWGVRRLSDVVRVGALPEAAGNGPVRLALAGRTLYIAAGDLYELDAEGNRLVALLSHGDVVAGGEAGDVRYVSIDSGKVVAGDGAATYARDEAGTWQRHPLAVDDVGGLRPEAPLITWGDATYGFSWKGDLVRFEERPNGSLADVWTSVADTPDLELARDLAIDGQIHVLLDDGRTLTFSRGVLVGTNSPYMMPALNKETFLADAPFADASYIVDPAGAIGANVGRIVQVDDAGETRQFMAPVAEPGDPGSALAAGSLADVQDLVVDELTGTVYWVEHGEIWRANLPAA